MSLRPEDVKKILVVSLSNLGDGVLTLPVFQTLTEAFPKAVIHAVAGPNACEIFQGDPRIQKLTPYNKKISWSEKMKFLKSIRREKYDVIVDLRYSLFGFLGGGKVRNRYFFFTKKKEHRARRHLRALKGITNHTAIQSWLRSGPLAQELILQDKDAKEKRVVLAVGSKSDIKKWPAESYAALSDKLAMNLGCRVVFVGDRSDEADSKKVISMMRSEATDMTGKTSLRQMLEVLQSASLVVTNDSAPLHLADALGVPVLAIFGPTDAQKYGPRLARSQGVQRKLFCSPCEKAQCRYQHECLRQLSVETVYQKSLRILNDDLPHEAPKILAIRLDRIGDVILTLPSLQAIRDQFPKAHLAVMLRPETQPLLEGHPWVDEVIPYDYKKSGRHAGVLGNIRFWSEIVRGRFDIAFILNPSVRSYLISFFSGIPYRVGFKTSWPMLLTHEAADLRSQGTKHESDYTLDVIRAFDMRPPLKKLYGLPVLKDEIAKIESILLEHTWKDAEPLIGIHPGASCVSKRWPKERFALLGKQMVSSYPHRLVLVGGKTEVGLGAYLREQIGPQAIDLTGKLDLRMLAALLKRCDFLISNDSGPVHVAAAVETRTLTLFGRNQAGLSATRWKALGSGHAVIQKDVGCVQCLAHKCPIDFECLKAISVDEVFEAVGQFV